MFKHLIKIFILVVGLCCFNPVFATQCDASAKLTIGRAGAQVTDLKLTQTFTNRTDLWLEINFDQLLAVGLADSVTNPVGNGAFCSITFGAVGARILKGTIFQGQDYIRITYGSPETSLINSSICKTINLNSSYTNSAATPFNYHWPDHTGFTDYTKGADYVAQVFWQVGGITDSNICRNTKLYIPLTSVQVNLGTGSPVVLDPNALYEIRNGLGTNQFVKNQTPLTFRPITGSCSVTAPSVYLGNFLPTASRTSNILGGTLVPTMVTLNCPNAYTGTAVKPTVTISDPFSENNLSCNPTNIATGAKSNAFIALFTSSTINDLPAGRYCASTVDYQGVKRNTMVFPDISTSNYLQTMPIYVGLRYNGAANTNPSTGYVKSTLQLTVSYD
jgi:hypothetical protein